MNFDSIYTAANGGKYDPLAVYRQLLIQSGNKINTVLTDWQGSDELASAVAEGSLVDLARSAFGLKGITESDGVTDQKVLNILTEFLEYIEKKD